MEGSAKCLPPARAAGRPSAGCPKAESKLLMSTPPHSCSSQRAHTRCTCSTRHTRHAWDGWHQTGALQLCHRLLHLHHRLHVSWIHHLLHSCGFRNISPTCGFAAIICCAIGLLASICSIIAVAHHLLHHLLHHRVAYNLLHHLGGRCSHSTRRSHATKPGKSAKPTEPTHSRERPCTCPCPWCPRASTPA